jgi:NADH-quinone oxidoreductase subunit L
VSALLASASHELLILLIGLPLLSFVLISFLAKHQIKQVYRTTILFHLTGALIAILLFSNSWNNESTNIQYPWFGNDVFQFNISFLLDKLSVLLVLIVMLIASMVNIYSAAYIESEQGLKRYFAMLSLFTFSMLLIVLSGNLLFLFIGWELVGFASYMLIGFWREKPAAAKAATKAFIMNRIGDAGFLIALLIAWSQAGTFELTALQNFTFDPLWQTAIGLCIFAGVMGKSAQFPLLTWLPDAMEGPTPVSALIHAATMVAAGIFLLSRLFFLLDVQVLQFITIIGAATSLMAALAAWQQSDIKKILAYSTISQLGLMVIAIGLGSYAIAILHLFTHAFFKAALFLTAGNIIHANTHAAEKLSQVIDPQDINNMGALRKQLPLSFISFALSAASLAGIPLFSGFISKEAIFSLALYRENYVLLALLFIISWFTVLYSSKMIYKVFFGENQIEKTNSGFLHHVKEPGKLMQVPALLLAFASVWLVVGWHPLHFDQWLVQGLSAYTIPANNWLTILTVGWISIASFLAYKIYKGSTKREIIFTRLLKNNFYLDSLYHNIAVQPVLAFAGMADFIDKRIIDKILHSLAYIQVGVAELLGWADRNLVDGSVNFSAFISARAGILIRKAGAGKIQSYIALSLLIVVIFLLWIMFKQI